MTITFVDADGTKGRIYVDGSGAIRTEHFASADATTPETYQCLKGTDVAETLMVDGVPRFHEQAGYISEDPRVFVFAALARSNTTKAEATAPWPCHRSRLACREADETRREHLQSATHSREQLHDAELGATRDGLITAFRDRFRSTWARSTRGASCSPTTPSATSSV